MNWLRRYFLGLSYRRAFDKNNRNREQDFREELYRQIMLLEEKNNISLTDFAIEMLLIPLEEQFANDKSGIEKKKQEIFKSLDELFYQMSIDKSTVEKKFIREDRERSSLSVIRAYSKKYCNIPPFCDRTN